MLRVAVVVCLVVACCAEPPPTPSEIVTDHCSINDKPNVCYTTECINAIKSHIKEEFKAAFGYMYFAGTFSDIRHARPGMAKLMYESASEEREHAIMMIEYLNKRGFMYTDEISFVLTDIQASAIPADQKIAHALDTALNLEIIVTKKIIDVITKCKNDYDGSDYFTNPILEEQYSGIRKIQGAIKDLSNLILIHEVADKDNKDTAAIALAEFLFDKKILANGI